MPKRKSVFFDELQHKYPCFKKNIAILKLNALLVDMEHLFLWQTKAELASMTILKPQNTNRLLEVKPHLISDLTIFVNLA